MKRIKIEAENIFLVDKDSGEYKGSFDSLTPTEKLPVNTIAVDTEPENGADTYNFKAQSWVAYTPPVEKVRQKEYFEKLSPGDQYDAILKGVLALTQLLKDKTSITDADLEAAGLLPDKTKPIDTPAGWMGTALDIKTKNPKPNKE